jgi:hypothetical protein
MTQYGPVYGSIPLIDTLPINGGSMTQQMPNLDDLKLVRKRSERTVAGYEVLLCHWHNQVEEIKRLKEVITANQASYTESSGRLIAEREAARAELAKAVNYGNEMTEFCKLWQAERDELKAEVSRLVDLSERRAT